MIRINLLPAERQKTELPLWKLYRVLAFAVLALMVLIVGYHLAAYKYVDYQLNDTSTQLSAMSTWEQRYNKAMQDNAEINKRRNIINGYKAGRITWSHFLAQLGNATPDGCWVANIGQATSKSGDTLTVKGSARNMDTVLDYLARLNSLPGVTGAQITDAALSKKNNTELTSFTIMLQRAASTSKAPAKANQNAAGGAKK